MTGTNEIQPIEDSSCVYRNPWCLSGVGIVVLVALLSSLMLGLVAMEITNKILGTEIWSLFDIVGALFVLAVFWSGALIFFSFAIGSIYATWQKKPLARYWNLVKWMKLWVIAFGVLALIFIAYSYYDFHTRFKEIEPKQERPKLQIDDVDDVIYNIFRGVIIGFLIFVLPWLMLDLVIRWYHAKCVSVCKSKTSLVNVLWGLEIGQQKQIVESNNTEE